jgi:hypothetical protein
MEKEMKCCFIFGNSKIVPSFIKELEQRLNTKIETSSFCGRYTIYVQKSLYEKAITVGTEILSNNATYNSTDASWFDYNNGLQSVGWILLFYGILPQQRRGDLLWCVNPPEDIDNFRQSISNLFEKECWIKYDNTDNALTFSIQDTNYEKSIQEIRKFLKDKVTPFAEIKFFNFIGQLL